MRMVDTDYAPGAIGVAKQVYRLIDLSANGTIINLGDAREMWAFADTPMNIRVGESVADIRLIREFHVTGKISRLVAFLPTYKVGRLVVYTGHPSLGSNWRRENYLNYAPILQSEDGKNWPALSVAQNMFSITLPSAQAREAIYLMGAMVERSNDKTLESIYFQESETGASFKLFEYRIEKNVTNFISFWPPNPIRIPVSGGFYIKGASDPAAQTYEYRLVFSYL